MEMSALAGVEMGEINVLNLEACSVEGWGGVQHGSHLKGSLKAKTRQNKELGFHVLCCPDLRPNTVKIKTAS